jgi:FRG domain-containing protein
VVQLERKGTLSFWDRKSLVHSSATDSDLLRAIGLISTYSAEARYMRRGQSDLNWDLSPGLVRRLQSQSSANGPVTETQLIGHEKQLIASARAAGYGRADGRTVGDVELLAVLQHHGAATRLLDVSSDPMVAVWFAVENLDFFNTDGVLFAINVSNAKYISGTERRSWVRILDGMEPGVIGFYEPPGGDERIKVQRGRFIFSKLTGKESHELSLPIDIGEWDRARRDKFFGQARGAGRPVPPSILVLKIPRRVKPRLLRLLENSYGYTSETMYPDLGGFATANGWQKPFRSDRRPAVELTESYLPVEVDPEKLAKLVSIRNLSSDELLQIARRELSISAERVNYWLNNPESAPQYWAAYHANEVVGVFEIEKSSWRGSGDGRYICGLSTTSDPKPIAVLGHSFMYRGKLIRISGRAVFVNHTKPRV